MTIIQEKNSPIIAPDKNHKEEELLSWLQEFHATVIKPLGKDLPEDIPDNLIDTYDICIKNISSHSSSLMISTVNNPGWSLYFVTKNISYTKLLTPVIKINTELDDNDWLYISKEKSKFLSYGGPSYISVIFQSFKNYFEDIMLNIKDLSELKETHKKLKKNNTLLTWLENFYSNSYDNDWGSLYGCRVISTKLGWIISHRLDLINLSTKSLERTCIQDDKGNTEYYKTSEDRFIIRTHSRGLIKGLKIFKEWVES